MLDQLAHRPDLAALTSVAEVLPGPVIVVGDDTRLLTANAPARLILPALRLGEPLALALRDPEILDAAGRILGGGGTETVMWRERVPVERVFEVTISRIVTASNTPILILSMVDRTEAQRVERMRSDFIANASHELRTPLASLLGFVETLQGPARDDTAARERFLIIMAEQARRMARLVDDLLSLSRIEQNLHIRPGKAVDIEAVVRHVGDTLAPLASERDVDVEIVAEGPLIVMGEWDELVRVAENLIENAIKYGCPAMDQTGPGPCRVRVSLSRTGPHAMLAVQDFGPGIAARHLPRLTERFYRVDAGQSRAKGGTGLGLALVKHILARHRGRLSIVSTPGAGATFTATLPLHG